MKALTFVSAVGLFVWSVLGSSVLASARASADGVDVTRILLVGDSVTQGKAGDHTWRYWLWKSLQAIGDPVDFVGPRTSLWDNTPDDGVDNSADYADPDFDQDHAARWGAMMTNHGWWVNSYPEDRTQDLVSAYRADVVVEDLGVNNLLFGSTPETLIGLAASFVADARAANPRATVVLAQLTQRWFAGVDDYNGLLLDLAGELDRPDARVLVALAPQDYTTDEDTWDNSHPNAQGEVKIAGQFFDVLSTLPPPERPTAPVSAYAAAGRLSAAARHLAVRLRLTAPVGATEQTIWRRDLTRHGRWRVVVRVSADTDHVRIGSLRRGHRYGFKTQAYRDADASTVFSRVARARAR